MAETVFGYLILISIDFLQLLVSIEKTYQARKTGFDLRVSSKYRELQQAARR